MQQNSSTTSQEPLFLHVLGIMLSPTKMTSFHISASRVKAHGYPDDPQLYQVFTSSKASTNTMFSSALDEQRLFTHILCGIFIGSSVNALHPIDTHFLLYTTISSKFSGMFARDMQKSYCTNITSIFLYCFFFHIEVLDKSQRRVCNVINPHLGSRLQSLSHRRDVASLYLFYKYFHGNCSRELFPR